MKQASTSLREPASPVLAKEIPSAYLDEAMKQKIQRHLNDINDVITEEDIRNIDTSITLKPASNVH